MRRGRDLCHVNALARDKRNCKFRNEPSKLEINEDVEKVC